VKLVRLKADGFGPVKGEFAFDPDKLTLLVDENERGKSSMIAAITAALYGLEDDRRTHRVVTPIERWRPWAGGTYRVELEVEQGGERLTIRRDFDRGTVEVWDGSGKDVTERFRDGKEGHPVGQSLLGLNVWEFEKCALVRQGELDQVVPPDEKGRRNSTLHARLENAADTKVGDTNATEALQVLEAAAASYTCQELGSTMKVETAIQRLETRRGLLESEIKTLDHDLAALAGPLEELARVGDEEQQARDALTRADAERRESLATDVKRRLAENEKDRTELERLREEAKSLATAATLPSNAEADLRETVSRYEESLRGLEVLEARRHEEQARERGGLAAEMEGLKAYASCAAEDADRFISLASEIRRIAEEDSRLRTEVFRLRDTLAGQGHMPERLQFLTTRFRAVTEEQQRVMRGQSELMLAFQTEVADLEQARTESTESLREIDALRSARRTPGWVLLALGLGTAIAGAVLAALRLQSALWSTLLGSGVAVLLTGVVLLTTGGRSREGDREQALRRLSEAQRRLNQLRARRAESELALSEMSRDMGYRDSVELMRDWTEYTRVMEESSPVMRAQEQIAQLEIQRKRTLEEVKAKLEPVGGGSPDPAHLERVAAGIRHLTAVRQRLDEMEKSWGWIDEEKRVAEAAATGLKERAIRILAAAGITYDPARDWGHHIADLVERAHGSSRHGIVTQELIPQLEKRVLSEIAASELKGQLDLLIAQRAEGGAEATSGARAQAEIEVDTQRLREVLETAQKRREDLRVAVEETWRRHNAEHPQKLAELETTMRALDRARRFKRSIELACETIRSVSVETHRRWADHLNDRVGEILRTMGTKVEQLRFGEDLDFSLKFATGQQVARGRAVLQLSSGAADQLHLAVRLAISEYLSRGQTPLPLLIDDAFATSDDERARAGMRMLLEHLSKQHQILFVTCHRKRYESFAGQDAELYGARCHWLEMRNAGAVK
jgi:DNA repair exonuclease SbcCD ATPase subunit